MKYFTGYDMDWPIRTDASPNPQYTGRQNSSRVYTSSSSGCTHIQGLAQYADSLFWSWNLKTKPHLFFYYILGLNLKSEF